MAGCTINAFVKNSRGRVVESKLWKDLLLHTSNNRELTKEYYGLGTSQEFLEKARLESQFRTDENGEITFNSLRKIANIKINKDALIKQLNEDIGAGSLNYQEAMARLQNFNRNSQYRDDFMATIKYEEDETYRLSVVDRTKTNERLLNEEISNRSLQDRIIYQLNKAGVGVRFLKKGTSKYSTKNAKRTAEGLYELIRIVNGKNVSEDLAEEAGHFVIGAMEDSPLVQRLLDLLNPDVQKEAVRGQESKLLGANPRREVAGYLVGQALANIDNKGVWSSLVSRIVNIAKKVFYTIKGDEVRKAVLDADNLAEDIASGFMSPSFNGSIETALKTKETLYSAPSSFNVTTFSEVLNRLKLNTAEMTNISRDLYTKFNNISGITEVSGSGAFTAPGVLADNIALEGIAIGIDLLLDTMPEIQELLNSVDFDNTLDFAQNMQRNAKALRIVRTYAKNAKAIIDTLTAAMPVGTGQDADRLVGSLKTVTVLDGMGNTKVINIESIVEDLNKLLTSKNGLIYNLANKESQYYLKFLESILGNSFVTRAARVVFNIRERKVKKMLFRQEATEQSLGGHDGLINYLESDISLFERFLGSMANSSDVVCQLTDKAVKVANKWADELTNNDWDRLRVIRAHFMKAMQNSGTIVGRDNTRIFCERHSKTGALTGYIISDSRWGEWEADMEAFKAQCLEDFKDVYPQAESLTEFERAALWDSYYKPLINEWHKGSAELTGHSIFDYNLGKWVPATRANNNSSNLQDYYNDDYDKLTNSQKNVLGEFMQLKQELDARLPEGTTSLYRMPQFKGTYIGTIRNKNYYENGIKALGHATWAEIRDTFCESSEDTEFGNNNTYNRLSEDPFQNVVAFDIEKLNRLPTYGINKLADMSEISTDLFHSMLAYSGMANSFAALNTIVDTLEVGKEVLSRRKVRSIKREKETMMASRAYNRYIKYLDKQVYGVSQKKLTLGPIVINKVASFLSGLASKVFLGGNVSGGLVNLGTGTIELTKEAVAGEYFTLKDWTIANGLYWASLPQNMWYNIDAFTTTGDIKQDKVSLMIRKFNIMGDSKREQRDWHTGRNRFLNFIWNESLFFPYKTGEHYMQTMSYLALANGIKLYDKNGNKISLFNAYKVVDNIDENNRHMRSYGKTLQITDTYFKDKADIPEYTMLEDLLTQIQNVKSNPLLNQYNLSQEQLDWLAENDLNLASTENLQASVEARMEKMVWSVEDESAFMDKAREINNRMHGVYNNQDKVAFQQSIYGNMLLAMKGYALGLLERRFSQDKYSVALGGESEGSYRTLIKVLFDIRTDRLGVLGTVSAVMFPFLGNYTKNAMEKAGFSSTQYRNMRRNWADGAFILALMMLKAITAKPTGGGDDEDEYEWIKAMDSKTIRQTITNNNIPISLTKDDGKKKSVQTLRKELKELLQGSNPGELDQDRHIEGICYYFASRLFREQAAFNLPLGMESEFATLTENIPAGISVLTDLYNLGNLFIGAQIEGPETAKETKDSEFYYKNSKKDYYDAWTPKWEVKIQKMLPYWRSYYSVYRHPYDAAEAFEFGRRLRTK